MYYDRVYLHEEADQINKVRSKFGLDTTDNDDLPDGT